MKKLLLLDADVIMDLHTLGLFEKITKTYEVSVARTVVDEAQYFKSGGKRHKIDIGDSVTIIDNVDIKSLMHVRNEAKSISVEKAVKGQGITKRIYTRDILKKCLGSVLRTAKPDAFNLKS